jgi:hypothetical protein
MNKHLKISKKYGRKSLVCLLKNFFFGRRPSFAVRLHTFLEDIRGLKPAADNDDDDEASPSASSSSSTTAGGSRREAAPVGHRLPGDRTKDARRRHTELGGILYCAFLILIE